MDQVGLRQNGSVWIRMNYNRLERKNGLYVVE